MKAETTALHLRRARKQISHAGSRQRKSLYLVSEEELQNKSSGRDGEKHKGERERARVKQHVLTILHVTFW